MPRVTVYHCTPPRRLPLIEEEGLRTRVDLSDRLGPPGALDQAAPGTFGHGKRVSGWLHAEEAERRVAELGAGLVSWSVDPAKAVAAPASRRERADDLAAYWAETRRLKEWLAEGGEPPADLEVHQNLPVRAKYVRIHAPRVDDEDLGDYAPLVAAVADEDRLSAKALMHLAVVASEGDFAGPAFTAACALAWRDEEDSDRLVRELMEAGPDKVASAALAEYGSPVPAVAGRLRDILEDTRTWAEQNGLDHGQGLFARTAAVLEDLPAHV